MKITAHDLAARIADDLFTNGTGKKANRLIFQMREFPEKYGGSLSRDAVVSRIQKHLEANLFWQLS